MNNYLSQFAGIGLATSMALTIQLSAQALDFTFSDFNAGTYSASGTFRISDSTPQGSIDATDLEDWEITLNNGAGGA